MQEQFKEFKLGKIRNGVEVGDQTVTLQELENQTDHRTLGEIEDDEQAQWDQIFRELKEPHRFNTEGEAKFYFGQCMMHALNKLGADIGYLRSIGPMAKKEFEAKLYWLYKIRVSRHRKSQENEFWKPGTYLYKNKELAYFISEPVFVQSEFILSIPYWVVRTNVRLPGGKGVKAA